MEYIINPRTNRKVAVGGKLWKSLIRGGQLTADNQESEGRQTRMGMNESKHETVVLDDDPPDDEAELQQLMGQYDRILPPTVQAVKGRGKVANKIVAKRVPNVKVVKVADPVETKRDRMAILQKAAELIKDNNDDMDDFDDAEIQRQLEHMVLRDMDEKNRQGKVGKQDRDSGNKTVKSPSKKPALRNTNTLIKKPRVKANTKRFQLLETETEPEETE